jgi:tetratricopeptide (TPR) repeat protein
MTDSQATLERASALHQQGRLSEAVPLYREVLTLEPRNVDALHRLGVALASLGDFERATVLLSGAAQLAPQSAAIQANLGGALSSTGRWQEALTAYERALSSEPRLPAALRGQAAALMQLGRHEAATVAFRKAVRAMPQDDQAWNGLGVVLERTGQAGEARSHFVHAVELNPANAHAHLNLGLLEAAAGRNTEALASFERALALRPTNPILHANLGTQLLALGRASDALESFERALTLQPDDPTTHYNRGLALFALKRVSEAQASFERALALAPDSAPARMWYGKSLLELNRPEAALTAFERARQLAPEEFEVHMQCGGVLAQLQRNDAALASFEHALSLNASSPEALNNRGAVLVRLFRPQEALADFGRALAQRPDYLEALVNGGNVLRALGRHEEAQSHLARAHALRPQDPTVRWSQAQLKLALGDFIGGWPLYEARLELPPADRLRHPPLPRWNSAEPLGDRTLLVYADQGLGDTLQFCRYIPVLESAGARVVLEVQLVLKQLLGSLPMRGTLIERGQAAPGCELCIPLASVPLALGTRLETIPASVPYLHADPEAVAAWKARLAALPGLAVGLNWHGNPEAEKLSALQARSFPLSAAAPLARVPGVSLISLQKGAGSEQAATVGFAGSVHQLTDPAYMGAAEIASETAPLLSALDLLITADTALAHLAGALGVRVWVMLQHVPDWRWLTERSDSPWYPNTRLFRQRSPGDWEELFARVAAELGALRRTS